MQSDGIWNDLEQQRKNENIVSSLNVFPPIYTYDKQFKLQYIKS